MTSFIRAGVLTASDRSARGERPDESGLELTALLETLPAEVVAYRIVADERETLRSTLCMMADQFRCDLVLSTGGTGLAPRDVTPEATRDVIDREIPGIAEALRAAACLQTPHGMLSRGVAGVRGQTLIVNLPGSPQAVREAFEVLRPVLAHAVALVRGEVRDCRMRQHEPCSVSPR